MTFVFKFIKNKFVRPIDVAGSYDKISGDYDSLFLERMRRYNVDLLNKIDAPEAPTILDLGCGTGFAISYFKNKFPKCQITGIDFSSKMLAESEKLVKERDLSNIKLIQGEILDKIRELPADSFDIVVCLWAFDYINPRLLLKTIHHVLKRGGFLGIITNSENTLPEVRKTFWKVLLKNPFKMKKIMIKLPLSKNQFHLSKLLDVAKFKEIKTWQGEEKFLFRKNQEATDWIFNTGALAGYDNIFDVRNNPEIFQYFNKNWGKDFSGNINITHKFISAIAKK